jgi:hypothetical protein
MAIFLTKVSSIASVCRVSDTKNVNKASIAKHIATSQVSKCVYRLFNLLDLTILKSLPNIENNIAPPNNEQVIINISYCENIESNHAPIKVVCTAGKAYQQALIVKPKNIGINNI